MKKTVVLLAMAVLLPVGAAMAGPVEDLKAAADYVKSGNKEAAMPLLDGIIADAGAPAKVKAQAYFVFSAMEDDNDPAAAVPHLDKAIAVDPTFAPAYTRKAEKLYAAKRYAEAAEAADAALTVQPGAISLLTLKTRCLFTAGDYANSARAASAALEAQPGDKEMLQYKAYGYYNAADYASAAEAFTACLQADNRNGKLYVFRGHSYLLSRQPDKALADFSTANRYVAQLSAQEQGDLQYYWGMAYLDAERFDLATGAFNKALGMNPSEERKADLERLIAETAEKKVLHAAMAQTRKDLERAKRNARGSVDMLQKIVANPQVPNDLKAQAYDLLAQTGQTAGENLAYADKAVELAPQSGDYLTRQGMLRFSLHDYVGALAAFDRTLALNPSEASLWLYRGVGYLGLADWTAAEKDFSKALELQPEMTSAYVYRARACFMAGNVTQAREDMKKVSQDIRRFGPMLSAEYDYVMGLLAQYDKNYAEALNCYARALNVDSSGSRGEDMQKRKGQLESLKRWSQKR